MASRRVIIAIGGAALVVVLAGVALLWVGRDEPVGPPPRPAPLVVEGLVAEEAPLEFQMVHGACELVSIVTAKSTTYPNRDEFCVVEFHVANNASSPVELDPACQFLIDQRGVRHAQRLDVLRLDPGSRDAFLKPIRAGTLVEYGALYYDVVAGTKPKFVELHTTCESRGVQLEVVEPPKEEG